MGKITVLSNVTADGFMSDAYGNLDWHFPYWDDELCDRLIAELGKGKTLLLGRKTYEALFAHTAALLNDLYAAKTDQLMAETMNRMKKIVITKALFTSPWNHTVFLQSDITGHIRQLQRDPFNNIVIVGSRQLVLFLMEEELVSNYELWQHPVKIRSGLSLFDAPERLCNFDMTGARQLSSGVVQLSYQRK